MSAGGCSGEADGSVRQRPPPVDEVREPPKILEFPAVEGDNEYRGGAASGASGPIPEQTLFEFHRRSFAAGAYSEQPRPRALFDPARYVPGQDLVRYADSTRDCGN